MRSEDTGLTWMQQVRDELIRYHNRSERSSRAELTAILLLNPDSIRHDREKNIYLFEEAQKGQNALKNNYTEKRKTYNIKETVNLSDDPKRLYRDTESKRAFLRGAFIASGSFTDPQKSYQFELVTQHRWQAEELCGLMADFGICAHIMTRRDRFVVYLKDGSAIADILNVIGAHKALMEFENIRIIKEMRETVNRKVNCETANIEKAVKAAGRQMEDINLIRREMGLDSLPGSLREICEIRLQNPEVGLSELGNLMSPPLGKSGVNHRFRKLSQIAEEIRQRQQQP